MPGAAGALERLSWWPNTPSWTMAKMMDGAHLLKGVPAQEAAFGVWTWNRPCERGLVGWGGGRTAPDVACMRRANGMRLIRRSQIGFVLKVRGGKLTGQFLRHRTRL